MEKVNNYNVRKLTASEIEVKPCQLAKDKSWVQILLYKTSRVDMQILTEMYGQKWKSEYKMVGDSLFCTISVYDSELGEWISRTDCGEKDAGLSEDKSWATSAFKRAATQFGIGIELYSTPKIKFNTQPNWFFNDKLSMTFEVSEIEWVGETLTKLTIVDRWGNVVWSLGQTEQHQQNVYIQLEQPKPQQNSGFQLQKRDNPTDANGRLSKPLYIDIVKSDSVERLQTIYQLYPELQKNQFFTGTLTKRKNELQQVS